MHYIAYCLSYIIWAIWSLVGEKILPSDLVLSFILKVLMKCFIWIAPILLIKCRNNRWLIQPKRIFSKPFPGCETFICVCMVIAFLHTVHILLIGFDIWGVFDPMWIMISLEAAITEEVIFRGLLFNRQAADHNVVCSAIINGVLFAIYHYPEFLFGKSILEIFGIRFWLITVMGVLFSFMFVKWRHLGMTIIIHFVWNIFCFWFALT